MSSSPNPYAAPSAEADSERPILGRSDYVLRREGSELGLCDRHARRQRNGILPYWLGSLGCIAGLIALGVSGSQSTLLFVLLALGLVACPIVGVVMARVVSAHRIASTSVMPGYE